MLNGVMLQFTSAFPSGFLGDFLNKLQEAGFFSYLLPFLLLFALVFGILTRMKVFKDNRVINAIIALAVALLALQFSFVPDFFSQIFPRVGVGLAIILAILIITGLFVDPDSNAINYILLGIAVITAGVIIIQASGATGWQSGEWWSQNWQVVVGAIILIILIAVIIGSAGPRDPNKKPFILQPIWAREK